MIVHWVITEMRKEHLDQVMDLERQCFPTPWTKEMFLYELRSPVSFSFIASVFEQGKQRLLGYVVFCLVGRQVHIINLATLPSFRRIGIALSLLHYTLDYCYLKGGVVYLLEVRRGNQAAIDLYLKVGFTPWRIRKNYYLDTGEDAITMRLFCGGRLYEECVNA